MDKFFLTAYAIRRLRGVSCLWSIRMGVFNFQASPWSQGQRTEAGDQCHMVARCWAIISDTFEDLCFTSFHEKLQKYPDHGHNTSFLFWSENISTNWRLAFFRYWELYEWTIPMHNWLRSMAGATIGRFGIVTSLSLEVQGPGPPYPSHPGASNCLGMFGACAGIFQDLVLLLISRVFSFWINTFLETWWCFDSSLTAISTQRNYYCDEWSFHNSLVPSHLPWRRAARSAMSPICFLDDLRLRQWRCSRLCWCPACKEALLSGKWFAHWHCILCWRSPSVFAVWWINPVDRLTCRRCDTLQNNILKQLLCSQPDITWNRFPSTPGRKSRIYRVRKSSAVPNKWNECMCAMRMTMENWTHKPHRQGFFSSNAIANIQLMKRSESQ